MQTLAGIIAIAALVCSARGAMNKDRVKPDISSTPSVDQQTPGASNNILSGEDLALYPTIGGSSTHPLSFTGNGNPVIRTGAASNAKSIPVNYAGIQPVAVNIEVSSTTTAIAVSVATVVATAVETVEAGAGHMAETEFSASTAIGSNRSIEIETPSTDPIILSNTNAFDFPPGAIKDSVEPFFGTAITTSPSILAVLGANETNDNAGGIGLGSPTLLSNNRPLEPTGKIRKRQAVTQNMPDGDSITFQTYHDNDRYFYYFNEWHDDDNDYRSNLSNGYHNIYNHKLGEPHSFTQYHSRNRMVYHFDVYLYSRRVPRQCSIATCHLYRHHNFVHGDIGVRGINESNYNKLRNDAL
ncbi:hypothetical protein DRE_02731 [Drechslerella stenobrocha 248]|uniref:Uncharacterized protein n=1 Tax=Drechslerella stenobrocha 248 TaxID=1043628 RepID=W7HWD6_9PEZI|nr:hypothetical protein DRE_02731 [Drechslerella stenobrocha 248]